jgi:hypothetical protein
MPSGSNNFQQWNPNQANQETDGEYLLDTLRVNGAVSGLFPSITANKLFYQSSTMIAAIGQMMSNKGYVISDAVYADLITALTNILTKADFGTTSGTVCQGNDVRLQPFDIGTKIFFYQNTAPTGWTIDATAADGLLAVKGGSAAYNISGGAQAGTWTQPTHTHTQPTHTHTQPTHTHTQPTHTHYGGNHYHAFTGVDHTHVTNGHTLTAAESGVPSHAHTVKGQTANLPAGSIGDIMGAGTQSYAEVSTSTFAGVSAASAHDHGTTNGADRSLASNTGYSGTETTSAAGNDATGASGNDATGASGTAATWRPLANVGIVCIKD